jgi:hypothetical protein
MDKYFRDLETQEAERRRADNLQYRRETMEWWNVEMDNAMSIKDYYMTVIQTYDEKLAFFDLVSKTFDDDEYGWDNKEQLDWMMTEVYDTLVSFQATMEDIDIYISDLNFEKFILEQQWTAEDESMYQDMMWRAEDQEADY